MRFVPRAESTLHGRIKSNSMLENASPAFSKFVLAALVAMVRRGTTPSPLRAAVIIFARVSIKLDATSLCAPVGALLPLLVVIIVAVVLLWLVVFLVALMLLWLVITLVVVVLLWLLVAIILLWLVLFLSGVLLWALGILAVPLAVPLVLGELGELGVLGELGPLRRLGRRNYRAYCQGG